MATYMKKLDKYFTGKGEVKGIEFEQISRSNNTAIYRVDNNYFEVFIIKTQKAKIKKIAGKEILFHAKELYPSSKDFGISAWTFKSYSKAIDKYSKILDINTDVLTNHEPVQTNDRHILERV